jgi:predicted nucleic acid-binding Zn ribbon protein
MKLTKSESGKLGALKSKDICARQYAERVAAYAENPTRCAQCNTPIEYSLRMRKFCSKSCSASHNNSNRLRNRNLHNCVYCGKEILGKGKKFCNNKCQKLFEYEKSIREWDITPPGIGAIKRYLAETFGHKCSRCGISSWCDEDIVLELEHKDGNSSNNQKDNVCLLCPNCHSQTETYKGKNRGKGRHTRMQRYYDKKSF